MKTSLKTENTLSEETILPENITSSAPEVEMGYTMVAFTQEELSNFANLISIASQTFETLALQAAQKNDEHLFTILSARNKLCRAYAARLIQFVKVGEPTSRDFH